MCYEPYGWSGPDTRKTSTTMVGQSVVGSIDESEGLEDSVDGNGRRSLVDIVLNALKICKVKKCTNVYNFTLVVGDLTTQCRQLVFFKFFFLVRVYYATH